MQPRRERQIELRHLGEKRVPVVGEAVLDLVLDPELREPDHRRLPQRQHLPVESRFELGGLVGGELHAVAPLQQARDLALAVEDALALHFGRMRGQHRAHQRIGEPGRHRRPVDAVRGDAIERIGDAAALRRRARERVRPAAPVLVDVLGDVGELREVAERADDVERRRDRQVVQQRGELRLHRRARRRRPRGGSGPRSAGSPRSARSRPRRSAPAARRPAGGRAGACPRAAAGPCRRRWCSGEPPSGQRCFVRHSG